MPTIIEIQQQALQAALAQLANRVEHPRPFFAAAGEDMMGRIKQRFATATDPDGIRWQANSRVTIMKYIKDRGGFSKKTGKISSKGQLLAINKRPLQGISGELARQFTWDASDDDVVVGSTKVYAAMQHFGGTKSKFPNLWGDIPARNFFPVKNNGDPYPGEVELLLEALQEYLLD